MPHCDVDVAANSFRNLAPVHVPALFFDGPDDLAHRRGSAGGVGEGHRASGGDEGVGARADQKVDEYGMWLVVGDQDGRVAVEGAGEEGAQEIDAVGQVDGNTLCALSLQVAADHGDIEAEVGEAVLGDAIGAKYGHECGSTARGGALFEGNLARDAPPYGAQVTVLAGRVHRGAGRVDGQAGAQRIAMGSLGRPEDGRLAWLAYVRGLCLAGQQERVRVSIGRIVEDKGDIGGEHGGKKRRVAVPAGEEVGEGTVELVEKAGHGVLPRERYVE